MQLRKQVRAEKAEYEKKHALLEQQIELLKLQLQESQKREKMQAAMSNRVIEALQAQVMDAENKGGSQAYQEHLIQQ